MIGFWIAAGILLAATLAGAAVAADPATPAPSGAGAVVAVFRRELADVEVELAQGRLEPEEAEAARAEITRRMLAEAENRG